MIEVGQIYLVKGLKKENLIVCPLKNLEGDYDYLEVIVFNTGRKRWKINHIDKYHNLRYEKVKLNSLESRIAIIELFTSGVL